MLGLGNSIIGGAALSDEFTPASLGSTLVAWYPFNTGIDATGTDGDASNNQMKWADASGNAKHAIQNDDANKPQLVGGFCVFDDEDAASESDFLERATGSGEFQFGHPNPFTITIALRRTAASNDRLLGADGNEFMGFGNNANKLTFRAGGTIKTAEYSTDGSAFPATTLFILTVTKDANGLITAYKNGDELTVSSGSAITSTDTDLSVTLLGANDNTGDTDNFDGLIFEFIFCDTVLSDSDRNATVDYVTAKLAAAGHELGS